MLAKSISQALRSNFDTEQTHLQLRDENIDSLQEIVEKYENLDILDLSGSKVCCFTELALLENLQELTLNFTGLQSLESLPILPNLLELHAAGNQLRSTLGCERFDNLQLLHLRNNQIVQLTTLPELLLNIDLRDNTCEFEEALKVFTEAMFINGTRPGMISLEEAVEQYFGGKVQTFCEIKREHGVVRCDISDCEFYEFTVGSFPRLITTDVDADAHVVAKKGVMLQIDESTGQSSASELSEEEDSYEVMNTFTICSLDIYEARIREGSYAELLFDYRNCEIENLCCTWYLDDAELCKNCETVKIEQAYGLSTDEFENPELSCVIEYCGKTKTIREPIYRRNYHSESTRCIEDAPKKADIVRFAGYPVVGDFLELNVPPDYESAFSAEGCCFYESVDDFSEIMYKLETPISWPRLYDVMRECAEFQVCGDVIQVFVVDAATRERIRIRGVKIAADARMAVESPFKLIFAVVGTEGFYVLPCPTAAKRRIKSAPQIVLTDESLVIHPRDVFDPFYSCQSTIYLQQGPDILKEPNTQPYTEHEVDIGALTAQFPNEVDKILVWVVSRHTNLLSKEESEMMSEKVKIAKTARDNATTVEVAANPVMKSRIVETTEVCEENVFNISEQLKSPDSIIYSLNAEISPIERHKPELKVTKLLIYQYVKSVAAQTMCGKMRENLIVTGSTVVGGSVNINYQQNRPNFHFGFLLSKGTNPHAETLLEHEIIDYLSKKHQDIHVDAFEVMALGKQDYSPTEHDVGKELAVFRIDNINDLAAHSDMAVCANRIQFAGPLLNLYVNEAAIVSKSIFEAEIHATHTIMPEQLGFTIRQKDQRNCSRAPTRGATRNVFEWAVPELLPDAQIDLEIISGSIVYTFIFDTEQQTEQRPCDLDLVTEEDAQIADSAQQEDASLRLSLTQTLKMPPIEEIPRMLASERLQEETERNELLLTRKESSLVMTTDKTSGQAQLDITETAKVGVANFFKPNAHDAENTSLEGSRVFLDFKMPEQLLSIEGIRLYRVCKHLYFEEIKPFYIYNYEQTRYSVEYVPTNYDVNFQIFCHVKDTDTKLLQIYRLTDYVVPDQHTNQLILQAVNVRNLTLDVITFIQLEEQYIIKGAVFQFKGEEIDVLEAGGVKIGSCNRKRVRAVYSSKHQHIEIICGTFSIVVDVRQNAPDTCYQLYYLFNALVSQKAREIKRFEPELVFTCQDFTARIETLSPCVFAKIGRNGYVSLSQASQMGYELSEDDLGFRIGVLAGESDIVVIRQCDTSSKLAIIQKQALREFIAGRFVEIPAQSAGEVVQVKFTASELIVFSEQALILSCPKGQVQVVVLGCNTVIVSDGTIRVKLHFANVTEMQKFYQLGDVTFLGEE